MRLPGRGRGRRTGPDATPALTRPVRIVPPEISPQLAAALLAEFGWQHGDFGRPGDDLHDPGNERITL